MDIQTALLSFINDGLIAGKTQSTLKGYQYTINYFIKYITGVFVPQQLTSINKDVLTDYFIYLIKIRKWNKYSQWTMYRNLNAFFNWCERKTIIQKNPLLEITKPKMPQQLPKSLSEKEVRLLLYTVAHLSTPYPFYRVRNKAVITTFLFTGIRKNELVNLKETDVDLINGFIEIECGKGGKRREIPIEQKTLKPILEEYHAYKEKLYKTSEWFFNGTFAGRGQNDNKLAVTTVDRLFWKLSKILNKHIYAHKLRHSFATLLLDKTGDIYTLKELLGHSNIKTTCIYLSSTRRKKTEAINKLTIY
jgi:site-specific recombinase XerD